MSKTKNIQIFCDFDGTITKEDTIKNFLDTFTGDSWLSIEKEWVENKIGSQECLERQLDLVKEISQSQLNDFLSTVEIDDYFKEFYNYVKANNIDFYVISDGLDFFIDKILKASGINDVKFYSNHLELKNNELKISFPNQSKNCKRSSGTCKCGIVAANKKDNCTTYYIGDGLSDCCVSDSINFVFAKDTLLNYCKKRQSTTYREFKTFEDILAVLKN